MTFADRLKQLREERGYTLEEIGQFIGVGRANIYKYEHGIVENIPQDKLYKLAGIFGVTREYLMGWTDERNANPIENLDLVAEKLRHVPEGEFIKENDTTYWRATGSKEADCTLAATQALRALIKFNVARTPIYPQQILQHSQYATVVTFDNVAELDEFMVYTDMLSARQESNLVMTCTYTNSAGEDHYLFVTNRNAPLGKLKLAMAIELGHIYLGHVAHLRDKKRKNQEAECFALHLEFPRPLIRLLQDRKCILTKKTFSRIFGDCEWCMDSILNAPPVSVSPELNRLVKEQFVPYVDSLEEMGILKMPAIGKPLDLSGYMAGYEE